MVFDIQKIENDNVESIQKLLVSNNKAVYKISIPKSTKQFFSADIDIAIEYAELAYYGQLLSEVSTKFDYETIDPTAHENVLYTVETNQIKNLAKVIYSISLEFNNEHSDGGIHEEVEDLLYKIEKKEINPACDYFYEIYKDFID